MTKKKKTWLIIGAVVVVVVIIGANLSMNTSNATSVQADVAKQREIVETVSASGRVQPQTKVNITSEINGEIVGLYVNEGDRVNLGDLLVLLDTVQVASDVEQAKYRVDEINARLAGAKTALEQNEEEFERQKRLFEAGLTSETEFKNARYAYQNSKASYEALQAQAQQFRSAYEKQLDYYERCRITAPMPGVITFLDAEVGEIAAAQTAFTQGKTLMTISNLDVFEVEVEVDETEIAKVEVSQPVDIEIDAFPDTVFDGEVVEVGNTAIVSSMGTESQSTNFRVKVIFKDVNKNIRPGMSATVDIETARKDDALSIPYSAVVMRTLDVDSLEQAESGGRPMQEETTQASGSVQAAENDNGGDADEDGERDDRREVKGTYVIRDGMAKFVRIETSIADQKYIVVSSGLSPDDSVISGPYRVLRTVTDGDPVQPRKTGSENE